MLFHESKCRTVHKPGNTTPKYRTYVISLQRSSYDVQIRESYGICHPFIGE